METVVERMKEMLRKADIESALKSPRSQKEYGLRSAIKNYTILLNTSLNDDEKAKNLGVSIIVVKRRINALREYGLSNPEEAKKYIAKFGL